MAAPFQPVLTQPGLYRTNGSVTESPAGSGLYTTSDLVETPAASGLYAFTDGGAFELTTTTNPPAAHMVFAAEDLPSGTHTIVVSRSYDGVTGTVRSAWSLFASGGAVLDDWDMPGGTDVSYSAAAFDVDGTPLGSTAPKTARVDWDIDKAWISDPTNPGVVVQVEMKIDFADTLTRVRQVQTYQVGDRVVALLGARGKLQNIPLRVQTKTLADADVLAEALAATSVLIRTMPPIRLPRLLYVVVPTVNEVAQDLQNAEWVFWDLTGEEISASTLDILVPVVTWQTYIDAFPGATWADVMAVYTGTWLDAIKNPPGV